MYEQRILDDPFESRQKNDVESGPAARLHGLKRTEAQIALSVPNRLPVNHLL